MQRFMLARPCFPESFSVPRVRKQALDAPAVEALGKAFAAPLRDEGPGLRFAPPESDVDVDPPSTSNHPEDVATETVGA